ncbi:protein arginine kinase [Arenicella sp.]|nr:protein arginine kinase [Arenicella sp.]
MNFETLLENPADWMQSRGPYSDIVLTSRVRLARNLAHVAFPGWASKADRKLVLDSVQPAVEGLEQMEDSFSEQLESLNSIKKQVLVERHLISREHAARSAGSAAVMNPTQSVSIMINEEDHLRMQAIEPGLNLSEAFNAIDMVDSRLEESLDYAFDSKLGYLTACPTNLGTGMRASVMLHLPALVLTEQINQVVQAVNKIGLAVRGLYGEGTEALGNLFQVSNQNTLGEKEEEIIARLERVVGQIINNEQNARQTLLEDKSNTLFDQIGRAYAVLRHSYIITSKEALNLLSVLRLAVDLECLPPEARDSVDLLLMQIQPAHLQIRAKSKLSAEKRDALRAEIMRHQLKTLPEPDILSLRRKGEASDKED